MSGYLSIPWYRKSGNSSDDDDLSDGITTLLQLVKPCDNEANVVLGIGGYFVEPQNGNNEDKWEINLKPHEKSDPFKKDKNLIGEVVYGRGGKPVGEFAFKDPEKLKCHAGKCKPDTQHARLHREMYGKCPEEEDGLVATGFAFKDGKMVFKSNTFNDKSKPHLDKTRYTNKQTREAGEDAQEIIRNCTDQWKKQNCQMDFTYSPQKKNNSKTISRK